MSKATIYVHFPFCVSKCAYCDFFSVTKKCDFSLYADCLLHEASLRKSQFQIDEVFSVYFGGGTPSILPPKILSQILDGLFSIFNIKNAEITIESNPDDFDDEFCAFLQNSKFNRISLGIQSMNDEALKAVSRRSNAEQNKIALQNAADLNRFGKKISLDFICGLPFETKRSLLDGISQLLATEAAHISLYSLMISQETPLKRAIDKKILPYNSDFSDFLWVFGRDFLIKNGFSHYEVSNFAKNGEKSRHNCAHWNCENYLGLGAGACGTFWGFSKNGFRYENSRNIDEWQKAAQTAKKPCDFACENEILDGATQIKEFLMLGFRKLEGISATEFQKHFGKELLPKIEPAFSRWKEKKLARSDGDFFALNEQGCLFLNDFLCEII